MAKRRTERLTGRERYEMISIGIRIGAVAKGAPAGKKRLKK